MLVDGHSLMYRAFHALPPMDADGVPTNAVHGFLSMLIKAFEEQAPQYCIVAFDTHGPTFRDAIYNQYKATRSPMPEELRPQFAVIQEILTAMHIGVVALEGYEADDLIGTLARQLKERSVRALILTGDKDDLQLVDDGVQMLFTRKGISETVLFDPAGVKDYFGVTPEQVTDWKGLMGDSSDNIPGVPGVGEKTALKLLQEYGTMDEVLANAGNIKGKLGERLGTFADQARLSRELATIDRNAPIQLSLKDASLDRMAEGLGAMRKYQMSGTSERLKRLIGGMAPHRANRAEPMPEAPWATVKDKAGLLAFLDKAPDGPAVIFTTQEELSIAWPEGPAAQVILASGQQDLFGTASEGMTSTGALKILAPRLTDGFIAHNAKALYHKMRVAGEPSPALAFDTMVAAYLHNSQERSYALQSFAQRNARGVAELYTAQLNQLKDEGTEKLYYDIELPLVRVLYDMEREGFQVAGGVLEGLGADFSRRSEELKEEIYRLTGVSGFNLNSPQQLGKVLFETLGLPAGRKTKFGYSTDAAVLESISDLHPAIPLILEYRQVTKLNSTYIDALLRKMDGSGRIHTTFDQTGTSTGRISSAEPNLQNIPIRTEMGREIRRAFIAKPGWLLVDADYSQIELRILAHMSGDEAMCDAFLKDQDIHLRTAAEINGVALDEVTPRMRSDAKAVNFGIVYGISDFGLARNLNTTRKRASDFISRYFERYPQVHQFMQDTVKYGYEHGYIATLFGRRRLLPELKSGNANTRNFGERAAMNTPIQGTAADIIKAAMVRVHAALDEHGLKARLILQVHDELIIEAPEEEVEAVTRLLKASMEQVAELKVPLKCDIKSGISWYDTK
ncbi:MAG: DNA polymerase I [Eubacteriales bacterium]|nr:DNA polymerase I [Eubacteriales bacterium]